MRTVRMEMLQTRLQDQVQPHMSHDLKPGHVASSNQAVDRHDLLQIIHTGMLFEGRRHLFIVEQT